MYSDIYAAENAVDATMNSEMMMGLFLGIILFTIVLSLISIISNWKIFNKAGKPGWASIIPFYNYIVMIQIAKLSMVYLLLLFIPIANIFAIFKINIEIAKKFGKSAGFGIGMTLIPIIFAPLLAFSDNTYEDNDTGNTKEENLNNSVNVQEQVFQPNIETVNMNANNQLPIMNDIQNAIPTEPVENNITNNEETNNNVSSMSFSPNIEQTNNEQIISTEQNVAQPIGNTNVENIPQINEVPVAETLNVNLVQENIQELPNAFNSKPVQPSTKTSMYNEPVLNVEPIINGEMNTNNENSIPTIDTLNNEPLISAEPIIQEPIENINMVGNPQINEVPVIELEKGSIEPIQVEEINNIEIPQITPQEITAIPVKEESIEQGKVCKNCGETMPNIVSICPKCGTDNE